MDETRAIARLPRLDIEIWHRRLPEEQAEQLAISLKATPSFDDFAKVLERQAPWPWLALQPWLMWGQIAQALWQPWLAALSAAEAGRAQPAPRPSGRPGSAAAFHESGPRRELLPAANQNLLERAGTVSTQAGRAGRGTDPEGVHEARKAELSCA